ncbi:hypothetical protein [Brevibacterium sp.]|uniref:hypothetical protein n=1 Tax=Brevibacterium sp. TaxID=1701 RepID=UPI0028125B97|nr:hypothetical protein [Brevibacterium sp.]
MRFLTSLVVGITLLAAVTAGPATAAPAPDSAVSDRMASAQENYQDTWARILSADLEKSGLHIAPGLADFWDERQRKLTAEGIAVSHSAGYDTYLAILPAEPQTNRDGSSVSSREMQSVWQEIITDVAADLGVSDAVFAFWVPDSPGRSRYAVFDDGALVRDFAPAASGLEVNTDVPGPFFHYALRTGPAGSGETPTEDEAAPALLLPDWSSGYASDWGKESPAGLSLPGFVAGVVVIAVGGIVVLVLVGVASVLRRHRGERLDRLKDTQEELRPRALSAQQHLNRRSTPASMAEAAQSLPSAGTSNDLRVLVAWDILGDETRAHASRRYPSSRCFFRPDRPAVTTRYWSPVGSDIALPVSAEAAEVLDTGRTPEYLSAEGTLSGRPYWTTDDAFARSGFGAFTPLSAGLRAHAAQSSDRPEPEPLGPTRPWVTTAALVAVVAAGLTTAGLVAAHNSDQRALSASPAFSRVTDLDAPAARALATTIRTELSDDGIAVAPAMLWSISPEDIDEYRTILDRIDLDAAIVVWPKPEYAPMESSVALTTLIQRRSPADVTVVSHGSSSRPVSSTLDVFAIRSENETDVVADNVSATLTALAAADTPKKLDAPIETTIEEMHEYMPQPDTAAYDRARNIGIAKTVGLTLLAALALIFGSRLTWNRQPSGRNP